MVLRPPDPTVVRHTRRDWLRAAGAVVLGALLPRGARAHAAPLGALAPRTHPEPRAGVTAARVLAAGQLRRTRRDARRAYDAARAIPEVLDGLACYCDCERSMQHRSLLSCFESQQGATCIACQEQALLALREHGKGRTLEQIRASVDEAFA